MADDGNGGGQVAADAAKYADAIQEFLDGIRDLDDEAAEYAANGSVRTVEPLTDAERDRAEEVIDLHDLQPKQCYWNCQLVAPVYPEMYTYVEGYVMSDTAPVPIQHAWVEQNGKVIELTMPDGPEPDLSATYFGVPYESEVVTEQVADLDEAHPVAGETKPWQQS